MQLPLDIRLDQAATLERYIPGPNAEALALAQAAAASRGHRGYLHGPPGTGKSHLLRGACRAADRQGRRAAYLPLRELLAHPPAVVEGMEACDLVAVDDLEAAAGEPVWEEALFRLVDRCVLAGASLLASGPRPPPELGLARPDLATRLAAGVTLALAPLPEPELARTLRLWAGERGLELPEATLRYLLARERRELPALLALLEGLDRAALAERRRLTVPFVRRMLRRRG